MNRVGEVHLRRILGGVLGGQQAVVGIRRGGLYLSNGMRVLRAMRWRREGLTVSDVPIGA